MLEIFNYLKRLETERFCCGVDREKVLFITMINENEKILTQENYNVDLLRVIEFLSNVIEFKESFLETYFEITRVLNIFKKYGNEKTTITELKKLVGAN